MNQAILYLHGKGGNAAEAGHYRSLFPERDVIGFDYKAAAPWEAVGEFSGFFDKLSRKYADVILIANSIGAFFAMHALWDRRIEKAFFISPVVDMPKLISDMMTWAGVTEEQLRRERVIETAFGETLSWEYLCYVRENPIRWNIPTHILYGERDSLTSPETVSAFASGIGASLEVMIGGEHWFHTPEQMSFLDDWIRRLA